MEREIKTLIRPVPTELYHRLTYAAGSWLKNPKGEFEFYIIAAFKWEDDAKAFKAIMKGVVSLTIAETSTVQEYCLLSSGGGK
jgi:hypothetical protein